MRPSGFFFTTIFMLSLFLPDQTFSQSPPNRRPRVGMPCANGSDPGPCLRCLNGRVVPDNQEDPGVCLQCRGGRVVPDNSEYPGACLKCKKGQIVSNKGASCNDGNKCTQNDKCNSSGKCQGKCNCYASPSDPACYSKCYKKCGYDD